MMKSLILLLLAVFAFNLQRHLNNPYQQLNFDKVIMYDFSGGKDWNQSIVDNRGRLATSITKQIILDKENIIRFNNKLGQKKSFGAGESACFDPHLGFVYYLKGKIVAHITICLDCNVLVSSIPLDAQKQGKVGEGKDAYYIADGPSKTFRNFLNELLKKHSFSHQQRS